LLAPALVGVLAASDAVQADGSVTFGYDQTGRVSSAAYDNGLCVVYAYDQAGNRTEIGESSDAAAAYPSAVTQTSTINDLNQFTSVSGQASSFDAVGNLLSDGQRTYSWDAENRLIAIRYPGQAGKQTSFAYYGLSRRTAINSTPAGGSAATTSYLWCGNNICQARDPGNVRTRSYYAEGEIVPGSSAHAYYYGPDQIGSTRRVFAGAGAPAYGYDPYGRGLQSTAMLTDFNYAGMFYNVDSGLYLTRYRAYDPIAGRWLSRDPAGEISDASSNLYTYSGGNPIGSRDPDGLWTVQLGVSGGYTLGSAAGVAFAGIAFDSNGGFGTYWGYGGGVGVVAGASGGLSGDASSASNIDDLGGLFTNVSRGGGWGESATGDAFLVKTPTTVISGGPEALLAPD
jgi:RHS repeat-associated protein